MYVQLYSCRYGEAKPEFRCAGLASQQLAVVASGQQRLLAVALSALARGPSELIFRSGC